MGWSLANRGSGFIRLGNTIIKRIEMAGATDELNKNGDKRGMSLNSQKNLGKGRKGNNHANKDYSITRIIKGMLDDAVEERWLEVEDKGKGLTWRQAIAKRMLVEAVRGNARVTAELFDRLEGKVTQPIGGEGGGPVLVEVLSKLRGYGNKGSE